MMAYHGDCTVSRVGGLMPSRYGENARNTDEGLECYLLWAFTRGLGYARGGREKERAISKACSACFTLNSAFYGVPRWLRLSL